MVAKRPRTLLPRGLEDDGARHQGRQGFDFNPPTMLFDGGFLHQSHVLQSSADLSSRTFDVVADGRFLMFFPQWKNLLRRRRGTPGIMVVQNWSEELKRLVPTH